MIRILQRLVIGIVIATFALTAADMLSGTWKLNPAKSKYNPGPAPKSATITYTMEGDWVVLKSEEVDSMGKAATYDNRYKFDGKEYPFKNALIEGAISLRRTDDLHAEGYLKGAKGKTNLKAVISKHGKTRTLTTTGVNAEGKPIHNVAVYEKQ